MAHLVLMTEEPTTEPINADDNEPATKKQFRELKTEVDGVDQRLIRVEDKLTKVEENTGRILEIVTSIDKHFKEHKDLPRKVTEHSDEIHKLKVKS